MEIQISPWTAQIEGFLRTLSTHAREAVERWAYPGQRKSFSDSIKKITGTTKTQPLYTVLTEPQLQQQASWDASHHCLPRGNSRCFDLHAKGQRHGFRLRTWRQAGNKIACSLFPVYTCRIDKTLPLPLCQTELRRSSGCTSCIYEYGVPQRWTDLKSYSAYRVTLTSCV